MNVEGENDTTRRTTRSMTRRQQDDRSEPLPGTSTGTVTNVMTDTDERNILFPQVKVRRTDTRSPWKTRFPTNAVNEMEFHDLENTFNLYTLLMSDEKQIFNLATKQRSPCKKSNML
jgi:hypothetical protein